MFIAKKFDAISCHELLHLLHQFNPFCTEFCAVTKQIQNEPKQYEMHQYYSLGSNGVDRVCLLQKIPMRLHGTTCALIGPVQPILHQVPCSNETLPNAPKHYEMLQNKSLVPMGWIGCVHCEKLWCDFMARTSSLIAPVQPVLHRVSCSNETNPKCTQTVRNEPILEFRVQWGGSGAFVAKNSNAS